MESPLHANYLDDDDADDSSVYTRVRLTEVKFKSMGQNDLRSILSTSYFYSFTLGGL